MKARTCLAVALLASLVLSSSSADAEETTPRMMQGEGEIERLRAEKTKAVTDAKAAVTSAEGALLAVKRLARDYKRKREALTKLEDKDEKARTEMREHLDSLWKEAVALDPTLPVDAVDLDPAVSAVQRRLDDAKIEVGRREEDLRKLNEEIRKHLEAPNIKSRLHYARLARCKTAYCFGEHGTEYAFEPMLELPIGTTVSIGSGALAKFNNATELTVQFSAGLRFWMLHDMVSVSMFFAKPIYSGDVTIRVPGSEFEHPTTSIRRIGPSFALGFIGDIIFIGAGYDQLRNGTGTAGDPEYEPNQVLSRAVTISIGIAPFAAIRNGAGALTGGK